MHLILPNRIAVLSQRGLLFFLPPWSCVHGGFWRHRRRETSVQGPAPRDECRETSAERRVPRGECRETSAERRVPRDERRETSAERRAPRDECRETSAERRVPRDECRDRRVPRDECRDRRVPRDERRVCYRGAGRCTPRGGAKGGTRGGGYLKGRAGGEGTGAGRPAAADLPHGHRAPGDARAVRGERLQPRLRTTSAADGALSESLAASGTSRPAPGRPSGTSRPARRTQARRGSGPRRQRGASQRVRGRTGARPGRPADGSRPGCRRRTAMACGRSHAAETAGRSDQRLSRDVHDPQMYTRCTRCTDETCTHDLDLQTAVCCAAQTRAGGAGTPTHGCRPRRAGRMGRCAGCRPVQPAQLLISDH